MAWSTPRTWSPHDRPTAAQFNQDIRDNELVLYAGALGKLANGYATATVNQAGITALVDLTSLTVTVTTIAGRSYKVTGKVWCSNNVAGSRNVVWVDVDGASVGSFALVGQLAGTNESIIVAHVVVPSAGAHTIKLRGQATAGTMTTAPSAGNPDFILVEDIGSA